MSPDLFLETRAIIFVAQASLPANNQGMGFNLFCRQGCLRYKNARRTRCFSVSLESGYIGEKGKLTALPHQAFDLDGIPGT
jgi:hypothetical protein